MQGDPETDAAAAARKVQTVIMRKMQQRYGMEKVYFPLGKSILQIIVAA